MKKLKFTMYGKTFYANLCEKEAPRTIEALEDVCPFESKMLYAKLNDEEVYFPSPLTITFAENCDYPRKGYVLYEPSKRCLCLFCGNGYPIGFLTLLGKVEGPDFDILAEVGPKVWEKQGDTIRVEMVYA